MSDDISGRPASPARRSLLRAGIAAGMALPAGALAARAQGTAAGTPDPLITEVQDWARYTGDGVDATPYGMPIHFGVFSA